MAVFTSVSDADMASFITGFDIGHVVTFKGIAEGVQNTNFLVTTQQHGTTSRFILTLYEERTEVAALPFFLSLMEHLSAGGIRCPTPLHDRAGNALVELNGRPAALVSFLDGAWVRQPAARHCSAVGEALARLHLAGQSFPMRRINDLGPAGWRPLYERFADHADAIAPRLAQLIADELAHLASAWPRDLPQGVVHADLFPDNVFFVDDRLSGLIDFYFAATDTLAYDIAICLNAWCFEPDLTFNRAKSAALLAGYQRVRPLSPEESNALPVLARGAAMRFLLTRAHDWLFTAETAIVTKHDPLAYSRRLQFHQMVKTAAAYGLEYQS
jgi:homoserine kinase type II